MNTIRNNVGFSKLSYTHKDVLSVFKQSSDKRKENYADMSVEEISEVVSEKIIEIIKQQFEETKAQIEADSKK